MSPKQVYRWRKGVEPSGGALHSLYLFADEIPGGVAIPHGKGPPDDLLPALTMPWPTALALSVRAGGPVHQPQREASGPGKSRCDYAK